MYLTRLFPKVLGTFYNENHSIKKKKLINCCYNIQKITKSGGDEWVSKSTYNTIGTKNLYDEINFKDLLTWIDNCIIEYCKSLNYTSNIISKSSISLSKSSSSLIKEVYNQISCHPSRSIAGSSLRSLSKIPHCWLKKPGPCLSASVVDHSFKPTKDRRLGRLLTHQLPNLPQTYLLAIINLLLFGFLSQTKR